MLPSLQKPGFTVLKQSTLFCKIFITSQPICFIFGLKKSSFPDNFTQTKRKKIGWLVIKILHIKVDAFKIVKPGFCRQGHIYIKIFLCPIPRGSSLKFSRPKWGGGCTRVIVDLQIRWWGSVKKWNMPWVISFHFFFAFYPTLTRRPREYSSLRPKRRHFKGDLSHIPEVVFIVWCTNNIVLFRTLIIDY